MKHEVRAHPALNVTVHRYFHRSGIILKVTDFNDHNSKNIVEVEVPNDDLQFPSVLIGGRTLSVDFNKVMVCSASDLEKLEENISKIRVFLSDPEVIEIIEKSQS